MKKKKEIRKDINRKKISSRLRSFFNKKNTQILILILLLNLLFNLMLFDPKLFTGGDNAVYISLAESIVSGNGYRDIFDPSNPPHTQYPFGFPLLIAPILYLWGHNYIVMKLVIVLLCSAMLYFLWKTLQHISSPTITFFVVLLVAFNPDILHYSHWILTEIPYLFFTILGIFLFEKSLLYNSRNIIYLLLSSLVITYSYFIRPTGLALIIAGFIILLLKKKFRYSFYYLVIITICLLPWFMRNLKYGTALGESQNILMMRNVYDPESGVLTLAEFIKRIFTNIKLYCFSIIPSNIFYRVPRSQFAYYVLALLTIMPAIYGFFYQIRKKISILHTYFILYLLMILPWHEYVSTERYFLPVMPIFIYFMCLGLIKINEKI